jgi:hypothetical protein
MPQPSTPDPRRRAYRSAARLATERMASEAPADARALAEVEASDIVVVSGAYDHVEHVLEALALPHTRVNAEDLPRVNLRPEQLLVVNCPGNLSPESVRQVEQFVRRGGSLFSTDWALRNLVEHAFPVVVAYNDVPTADAVVRIEVSDHDNPFLRGVLDGADEPVWWLEGSSYPIRILDRDRVQVLLSSRELGTRWGERPVAVLFRHGDGEVFHMISHYYLQRTELRSARQAAPAARYWDEKGLRPSAPAVAEMADLTVGDVESAATSARLFANVVADKKRRGAAPREGSRR